MSNEWEEFRKEMASMRAYLEKDIPQKNADSALRKEMSNLRSFVVGKFREESAKKALKGYLATVATVIERRVLVRLAQHQDKVDKQLSELAIRTAALESKKRKAPVKRGPSKKHKVIDFA